MLMQIDELNAHGGLLGKKIEPIVVDPASNWPLFAEKARELISKDKVVAVFGCWTSVSRKSVLPVFEELNGLLFYPLEYEGEEDSYNVFYGSSVPDNKAIPAVKYLMSDRRRRREALRARRHGLRLSAHQQQDHPRVSEIDRRRRRGHHAKTIRRSASPTGRPRSPAIKAFGSTGKKTAVVSTINGDANVPFYKELGNQGVKATDIPVIAFSVGEEELRRHRHQAARRPSRGLELFRIGGHAREQGFHQEVARLFEEAQQRHQRPDGIGLHPVPHVGPGGAAGGHDRCRRGAPGDDRAEVQIAIGRRSHDAAEPSHGQARDDRRDPGGRAVFDIVYQSPALPPKPWSPYVEANKGRLVADWSWPWVCGGCTAPKYTTF